jgi:cobalt-zinc-cadmium efflux system outer membrane protein
MERNTINSAAQKAAPPTPDSIRSFGLLLFVVCFALCLSSCAPRLDAAREQVSENVAARLPGRSAEITGSNPSSKERECWIHETLKHPLQREDAVAIALLNNRRLRAIYAGLGVHWADLVDAGLPRSPVFLVERRFSGQALEIDVAQDFLSIFLIPLRRRRAEAEFEAAKFQATHEILQHAFSVRQAFFELQAAEQMREMRKTVAAAQDASSQAARALYAAGNTTQLETARQGVAAAAARLALATAETDVVMRRERLNVLMGLWGENTGWSIAGRLPAIPSDDLNPGDLEKQAIADRYDMRQAEEELKAAAAAAGETDITGILPELSVTGHFEREIEGRSSSGPGIEFPIPIFDWGRATRARAQARYQQAAENYAALAVEIRSEVRSAYAKTAAAAQNAEYYRSEILPLRTAALRETQRRYNGMFAGVFQLLEAKQEQIEAAGSYLEQLREYWLSRTELEKAIGRSLPFADTADAPIVGADASSENHHHHQASHD